MKKLKLLFFAISPFIIGYLLNYVMLKFKLYGAFVFFISILFFIYWFFAGYTSANYTKTTWQCILIGNSFAIVSIILIVFQEVVLGRYLFNLIGILPQMFYLPAIAFTSWVERIIMFFILTHYMWITCILAFILMVIVYFSGYLMRLRKVQRP